MNRKELKSILEEFKKGHPDLMALEPRVEISPGNSVTEGVPVPQIYVWHPFVFDSRLIPKDYNGIKVTSVTISSTLPECLNPSDDKPLWQVEDPANYVRFVEENHAKKEESTGDRIKRSFFDRYVDKIKDFLDNAE